MSSSDTLPLVSVGMPTYNRPDLLARALNCIVKQSYQNLEIIISDNASPDIRVEAVAREYCARDSRIRYVRNPKNIGAIRNFWSVLGLSRGEFFMWAADDDEWETDFIEYGLKHIGKAGTVMGNMETIFHVSETAIPSFMPHLDPAYSTYENAAAFLRNMQPSIIYGLHRTDALRSCIPDREFDFLDCFVVYKMILRHGIKTCPGVRYRAGVHSAEYIVKTASESQKKLIYAPFVIETIWETFKSKDLRTFQKLRLSVIAMRTSANLFLHLTRSTALKLPTPYAVMRRTLGFARTIWNRAYQLLQDAWPRLVSRSSFSQSGEDMIVDFALRAMRIDNPTYLDVGANHPFIFNNTYYFYTRGYRGVSVEPDPRLYALLVKKRPREKHLNIGVGAGRSDNMKFYVMSNSTLSTFSQEEANRYAESGSYRIERILNVDLIPITEIFDAYFGGHSADFVSIDVEGLDFEIISSIDFERYRPAIICVETIVYSEHRDGGKVTHIEEVLKSKGYMLYADTHINTIFVDRERWVNA